MNNLVETVIHCLESNDFSNAIEVINDSNNELQLRKHGWDLIPIFFKNITKDMEDENEGLLNCSKDLLEIVARKAEPEEVVLEFLDQMDRASTLKFCFILKLLGIALPRCSQNRQRFIESSLVSIRSFLEEYIISDVDYVSEDEYEEELYRQLPEITTVFSCVVDFYSDFINIVLSKNSACKTDEMVMLFSSRLIQLYDLLLPLGKETHLKSLTEVEQRIMKLIITLVEDPFYLLQFLFVRSLRKHFDTIKKQNINWETENLRKVTDSLHLEAIYEHNSVYEDDLIINNLGYAVFYFSILCNNEREFVKIPSVYNPKYIFLSLAFLSVSLFEKKFNKSIRKGLFFLENLLNIISGIKLERLELYFDCHEKILVHLNNIMVYSQFADTRKLALNCFKRYIESFDYEGRYLLLFNIRDKVQHSGTLGFLITLLKEYISYSIDYGTQENYFQYYSGQLFYVIIAKYCFLAHGEKTDLVENADQIISALNMLRFLILKDKENKSGVRDYLKNIELDFLTPLQTIIVSSKEFYELKLEECGKPAIREDHKVELTLNGQPFTSLSKVQQENALFASLNAVDLINSLLLRVYECIKDVT